MLFRKIFGAKKMEDQLSKEEFNTLVRLAKKVLWSDSEIRKKLQDQKVNIVPANFYSDIPLVDDVNQSFEYKKPESEIYNCGVFDKEQIAGFIEALSEYSSEFSPPLEESSISPDEFYWRNPAFSYSDAMAYYCVIRHFKPDHILEIGSGFSTLVANEALLKNGKGKLTLIEPYPKDFLRNLDRVENIVESFVQDIPVAELVALVESSDIWFIDSTHTVKVGSDCLYLYLLVMPQITKDIIIHSHDIHLPYGLPKAQVLEKHIYWTEQYLLYAYMLDNPKINVLFSSAYSNKVLPDSLAQLMQGKYPPGGASIWYQLSPSEVINR